MYREQDRGRPVTIQIEGVRSNECPRSINLRNPSIDVELQKYLRRKRLKSVGVTADGSATPIRTLDAFDIFEQEDIRLENARNESRASRGE